MWLGCLLIFMTIVIITIIIIVALEMETQGPAYARQVF